MSQLNIQNRKLSIIEQVIVLNDDEILKHVEDLIISGGRINICRLYEEQLALQVVPNP